MFTAIPAEQSGVGFNNEVDPAKVKSPIEYINVYNGAGVAIGDINNDGLQDIYFTGNVVENKLYLNKGNFQFEDITQKAGVAVPDSWCTGVTMTDVNEDGLLDIYVCRAYHDDPFLRSNLLFINNGDLTFSEKAAEFGIADPGYAISATFLDYNKDGHPDLYVGNHPLGRTNKTYLEHIKLWQKPSMEFSDKLYKNNGDGTFTDVTKKAGILNYCWTLGVVAADLNEDGWTDIYVAADHTEPDRYYQNNGDGTFQEVSAQKLKHMSHSSMGVDAADINNDGLLDLAVVEMAATNNFDEKTNMPSMNPERFWAFVKVGYHYQYMRNMLQLNTGDGYFSEIGQMAGVHRTNWSWASLLADFDNDGYKDYFVSNGYLRMYNDKDHHKKFSKTFEDLVKQGQQIPKSLIKDYGAKAPEARLENNFFRNNGDLTFTEMGPEFGLNFKGLSSGAAYADLDNDGDLDLVVNNTNDPALIYKNENRERTGNNFFRVALKHPPAVCPIGTK
ncbi:MAG: VCBS repeat-containing protein, partial [Gammaproteobacteria bacterium]